MTIRRAPRARTVSIARAPRPPRVPRRRRECVSCGGRAVSVESGQLGFSLTLLLIMLVTVVVSIMASNWMLGKRLGYAMFMLYGIFLLLSLLAEFGAIKPNF